VRPSSLSLDWSVGYSRNDGLHCPASPRLVVRFQRNHERSRRPAPLHCSYFSNIVVEFWGSTGVSISGVQKPAVPGRRPPPLLPWALPRSRISHPFLQSGLPGGVRTPRRAAFPHLQRRTRAQPLEKTERAIFPLLWPMANATVTSPLNVVAKCDSKTSNVLDASARGSTRRIFHFQQLDPYTNLHGPGHTHLLPVTPEDERGTFRHACSSYRVCASPKYRQTDHDQHSKRPPVGIPCCISIRWQEETTRATVSTTRISRLISPTLRKRGSSTSIRPSAAIAGSGVLDLTSTARENVT